LNEALGDDAADDLLACFQEASEVNRAAVRELADLYFARSEARIDQRMAELRGEMHSGLANQRAELLKWMFLFWAGTVVPLAGLILAFQRR
jgi:hypothetical protein